MSKSLGNFFTVRDLLDQGVPGEVIRFVMLSTHYRKPMDWTARKAEEAKSRLTKWYRKTEGIEAATTINSAVEAALLDDLNTHLALTEMNRLSAPSLKAAMRLIGLPDAEAITWYREQEVLLVGTSAEGDTPLYTSEISPFLRRWQALRDNKEYEQADQLKRQLEATGLRLSVSGGSPNAKVLPEFHPSKLETLK